MTQVNTRIASLAYLAALALSAPALAGAVSVNSADGIVTLEATDASVDVVMENLAQSLGFEVERLGPASCSKPVWGRYSGSLGNVLSRALEKQSHLILYSAATSAVEKVVLFGSCEAPVESAAIAAPQASPQPQPRTSAQQGRSALLAQPKPLAREIIPQPPAAIRSRSGVN